jgi:pimeloyl-ACP methyl ester carboxylesterase
MEQRRIATREGETFIAACGPASAPPVVLLQGSGANAAMWLRDIASLARHHRAFAVDMIGEPGFSAPSRPPLTSDAHALWLDDVMNALGLVRGSFVGMSLGGWLALDYAIRRPDRVEKVVVIFGDEDLTSVTAPLLAIVGSQDALLDSQGTADRLQRLVPRASVRFVPEAGHFVRNQAATIVDFLRAG